MKQQPVEVIALSFLPDIDGVVDAGMVSRHVSTTPVKRP
jgi:hypothetical protein